MKICFKKLQRVLTYFKIYYYKDHNNVVYIRKQILSVTMQSHVKENSTLNLC